MAGKVRIFRKADELLTMSGVARKQGRKPLEEDLGLLKKASFVVEQGRIAWVGPDAKLPKSYSRSSAAEVSLEGTHVLPGFVECHTHTIFAGDRAAEFEMRNQGVSYQEISARGGGILSTVQATRKASRAELLSLAQARVNEFVRQGVTTLEIKSGYGLSAKHEIRLLEVAGELKGPRLVRSFLGAHAKSPDFPDFESYLNHLTKEALPKIWQKKLAERVDIFIEKGFFEAEAGRGYLEAAKALGFQVVIHADQLSLSGGARLAVALGAQSADHVIQIQKGEIEALAKSETTSVLLPAADLYMKCAYPPARALIDQGARVALATDFNPGSSPTQDLALVGLLARLEMKMSLAEVLAAYTWNAAAALGRQNQVGSLEVGKAADFVSTSGGWRQLFYSVGGERNCETFVNGRRAGASRPQ